MKLKNESDFLVSESRQFFLFQTVYFRTIQHYPSAVRFIERTHYLKQGSLSCPARSDNTHHFSFIYNKVYPFQYLQ